MIGREFRRLLLLIGLSDIVFELLDIAFPRKEGILEVLLLLFPVFPDERFVDDDTIDLEPPPPPPVDDEDEEEVATCFPTLVFEVDISVEIFATVAFVRLNVSFR